MYVLPYSRQKKKKKKKLATLGRRKSQKNKAAFILHLTTCYLLPERHTQNTYFLLLALAFDNTGKLDT
jgi:hypothetical protein